MTRHSSTATFPIAGTYLGFLKCIDNFGDGGGWLTALAVNPDQVWRPSPPHPRIRGISAWPVLTLGLSSAGPRGRGRPDIRYKLLRKMLRGRDVVIVLDLDAATEASVAAQRIHSFLGRDLSGVCPGKVAVASFPDDRAPGDCSREEILAAARQALARRTKRHRR